MSDLLFKLPELCKSPLSTCRRYVYEPSAVYLRVPAALGHLIGQLSLTHGDDEIVVTHRALIVVKVSRVTVHCAVVFRKWCGFILAGVHAIMKPFSETCTFFFRKKKYSSVLTVPSIICSHLWEDALSSNSLLPQQYFTGLECGHKFCMQCWGDYLTTKIIEEGMGQVHTNVSEGVGSLWGFGLFSGWCSAFCSFLLRPFRALLIVVTFWLMTTQSCEYLRGTKFQFLNTRICQRCLFIDRWVWSCTIFSKDIQIFLNPLQSPSLHRSRSGICHERVWPQADYEILMGWNCLIWNFDLHLCAFI